MKTIQKLSIVVAVLFSGVFAGCQECETKDIGEYRVVNNYDDPYRVYLDNVDKGVVGAYSSKDLGEFEARIYSVRFVQESGFVFTPNEIVQTADIPQCKRLTHTLNP